MPSADRQNSMGSEFDKLVAAIFRKAGWRVRQQPSVGDEKADFLINAGELKYLVEVKAASEGRGDRLIPLLAQAILKAQAFAGRFPERVEPLAVVVSKRIPPSTAEDLKLFAERYAPNVAIGVIDMEGLRAFKGQGLEKLEAKPIRSTPREIESHSRLPGLFSDLNQWMLKILLGQRLPEPLISVPRRQIRNASQLAAAASVSIMSASRFLNQLANQGFLAEEAQEVGVVRVEELLEMWVSSIRQPVTEYAARWVIKKGQNQIVSALLEYGSQEPNCCLGLFSAADALGFGMVHGIAPYIYLERLTLDSLGRLGLLVDQSKQPADVYIRIPESREAIFRASVNREGIRVSDILQVWLDVSNHPTRGREQAREIRRRVLAPLFRKPR